MPRFKRQSTLTLYHKSGKSRHEPAIVSTKRMCHFSPRKKRHMDFSPMQLAKRVARLMTPIIRRHSPGADAAHEDMDSVNEIIQISPLKLVPTPKSVKKSSQKKSKKKLEFEKSPSKEESLINEDLNETINRLTSLIRNGKYCTNSISFQLFKDALKWHEVKNTSAMRYSEATKEFFWTGKRLLGGQFIRFMRGFAHNGFVADGSSPRGKYDPMDSGINLPVPSDSVLKNFRPSGLTMEEQSGPGIMNGNIDMYGKAMPGASYVVMFDGKKITPQSADIYLLDKEEEPKISKITASQNDQVHAVDMLIKHAELLIERGYKHFSNITDPDAGKLLADSKRVISVFGTVTKSLRQCYCKKAAYLQSTEKKLQETNQEKFKFVCNRIKTLMYQIKICLNDLMDVIDSIVRLCACINHSLHLYRKENCDMMAQSNYRELKPPTELAEFMKAEDLPDKFLKQRTPEWFALRKKAKVTGSVAHTALGLDTLVGQRQVFDKIFSDSDNTAPSDRMNAAMKHGSDNEINAVATVVGKIMPVFYPDYIFYEEGAYVIRNETGGIILVVSPDGSVQKNGRVLSVEVKCPFPAYVGSTPVYYEMKPRHVVQNCLEAEVLNAEEHLYVSWSKDTTTVFRMKPNEELVKSVFSEIQTIYYGEYPCRPTNVTDTAKSMKKSVKEEAENAEFLGEFPSLIARSSSRHFESENGNMHYSQRQTNVHVYKDIKLEDVVQYLLKGVKEMNEAFTYQKPMASEVLVYLLSDMDRTWHPEIGHGLPIAYLFKGYSLTMATSRRLVEEVLDACCTAGVHVPCVSFDGKFSRLKDYDINDDPLSLFVLQRKFWIEVQKNSKSQLINAICDLFKPEIHDVVDMNVGKDGILEFNKKYTVIQNVNKTCLPIETSVGRLKQKDVIATNSVVQSEIAMVDCAGLDEDVLDILQQESLHSDTTTASNASNESCERDEDLDLPTEPDHNRQEIDSLSHLEENINVDESVQLERSDFEMMQAMLKDSKRPKWDCVSADEIKIMFKSAETLNKELSAPEVTTISKFINLKVKKHNITIAGSLRKPEKINLICKYTGIASRIAVPQRKHKAKSVKSLKGMCTIELQKRNYPKEALCMSYARSYWPCYRNRWFDTASVKPQVRVDLCDSSGISTEQINFSPVYSPEYSQSRQQLEVRVMDGTHIRTNINSKIIRQGLANIHTRAWKKVAASKKTKLATPMLEVQHDGKIMHQQSDPYVRTMFAEDVEQTMVANGDVLEAQFCRLFREWHEAEDQAGISAAERCKRSLRFREWLLDGYDFGMFPPPTQYVKGIPRITYEGLVCSIDANILLYGLVKRCAYNWRTVSTLVAENFMGELAEQAQNNHGVPSGKTLPSDMDRISELHAMRLNPGRYVSSALQFK